MSRKFTQGNNPDERLDHVERHLEHMQRRLVNKVGAMIPPVPVSFYCEAPESNGTIFRYMLPAKGRVKTAVVLVENFPEKQKRVNLTIDVSTPDDSFQKHLGVPPAPRPMDVDLDVIPGSRFTVRLAEASMEARKIWIAFLYQIEPKNAELKELLVSELERSLK